jgi:hypothetical protein
MAEGGGGGNAQAHSRKRALLAEKGMKLKLLLSSLSLSSCFSRNPLDETPRWAGTSVRRGAPEP